MSEGDPDPMDPAADEDDEPEGWIPVWPENLPAAEVFERIRLERDMDNGLTVYTGVRAEEIRHWMELKRIPPARQLEVAEGVQTMVRAACPLLNERIVERYRTRNATRGARR